MIMRLPPKLQHISRPATGDARLNGLIKSDGQGRALNVSQALADKVGHKLTAMAKSNPDTAAALLAHIVTLSDQGKVKIPAGQHGMDSSQRYALFQPVLQQLNSTAAGKAAMAKYELPAPEGLKGVLPQDPGGGFAHPLLGVMLPPKPENNPNHLVLGVLAHPSGHTGHLLGRIASHGGKEAPKGSHMLGRLAPEGTKPGPGEVVLGRMADPGNGHAPAVFLGRVATPDGKPFENPVFLGRIADPSNNKPFLGRMAE